MVEEYSEKELNKILDKVYEWGVEFSKSKYFEELTEEQKRESESVVMFFTEYMYTHSGLPPEKWDSKELRECCMHTLPRKVTAQESFFKSVAPVLSAFFTFLAEKGLIRNAPVLAESVKEIDKQIVKNASKPENWGMAKTFAMAALKAGVDVTNEEEMQKFVEQYNRQLSKPKKGKESKHKRRRRTR
nr:hypothetical protein [Candidatus Freyarchaeota archaeon]